jgi:hypothetical protein
LIIEDGNYTVDSCFRRNDNAFTLWILNQVQNDFNTRYMGELRTTLFRVPFSQLKNQCFN